VLLAFVTTSPLHSTGAGWDYKVQLQASGGSPPIKFLTPYYDPATGAQKALSCSPPNPMPTSLYYPGKMMVDGLTLTCDGIILGQPKAGGRHAVTIVATDACPLRAQRIEHTFILEVK
jgi:hypothetical protein